jgi:hypothetical protein
MIDIHNCGTGEKSGKGLRCSVIGSGESRGHAIAVNHVCDRYKCNCCERGDEYNGFGSGLTIFTCPKKCTCHD